ncbi:hypothetical protein D3C85_720730 [compost metagenome]
MIFTSHGRQRWAERCSHLHLDAEVAKARKADAHTRQMVNTACRKRLDFDDHRYWVTPGGAVLVVDRERRVVTVFTLEMVEQRVYAMTTA